MLNLTMEDFKDNADEIAMLYELLKPKEIGYESEEEACYFNSPQYRSHLYRFVYSLTNEQRDILNIAVIIGYWFYEDKDCGYNWLSDINAQNVHVDNIEKWCSKLISKELCYKYVKIFLNDFLHEFVH